MDKNQKRLENALNKEAVYIQNPDEYEEISTEDNHLYKVVGEVESLPKHISSWSTRNTETKLPISS